MSQSTGNSRANNTAPGASDFLAQGETRIDPAHQPEPNQALRQPSRQGSVAKQQAESLRESKGPGEQGASEPANATNHQSAEEATPCEDAPLETGSPAEGSDSVVQQMRVQVSQLAAQLREKQVELDRRETQHHVQSAQLEQEMRAARLWIQEREESLSERENQMAAEVRQLQLREATVATAELTADKELMDFQGELQREKECLTQQAQTLDQRETQLTKQQQQLERDEKSLSRRQHQLKEEQSRNPSIEQQTKEELERSEERQALSTQEHESDKSLPSAEGAVNDPPVDSSQWSQPVETSETYLHRQMEVVQRQSKQLEIDRQAFAHQAETRRRQLDQAEQTSRNELAQQRRRLQQQQGLLETRRNSLQQMQAEVTQGYRDALEMRLATEELWAQLAGQVPPAVLTQSLSKIRQKLDAQFARQVDSLHEQQEEIRLLTAEMEECAQQMRSQKHQRQQWMRTQHQQAEEQAARLVAREQELDLKADQLRKQQAAWENEKIRLEGEIWQLRTQIRREAAVD